MKHLAKTFIFVDTMDGRSYLIIQTMSLVIPLLALGDVKGSFALRIVYTYADFQLWFWVCMYVVLPVYFNVTRNVGVPL